MLAAGMGVTGALTPSDASAAGARLWKQASKVREQIAQASLQAQAERDAANGDAAQAATADVKERVALSKLNKDEVYVGFYELTTYSAAAAAAAAAADGDAPAASATLRHLPRWIAGGDDSELTFRDSAVAAHARLVNRGAPFLGPERLGALVDACPKFPRSLNDATACEIYLLQLVDFMAFERERLEYMHGTELKFKEQDVEWEREEKQRAIEEYERVSTVCVEYAGKIDTLQDSLEEVSLALARATK